MEDPGSLVTALPTRFQRASTLSTHWLYQPLLGCTKSTSWGSLAARKTVCVMHFGYFILMDCQICGPHDSQTRYGMLSLDILRRKEGTPKVRIFLLAISKLCLSASYLKGKKTLLKPYLVEKFSPELIPSSGVQRQRVESGRYGPRENK